MIHLIPSRPLFAVWLRLAICPSPRGGGSIRRELHITSSHGAQDNQAQEDQQKTCHHVQTSFRFQFSRCCIWPRNMTAVDVKAGHTHVKRGGKGIQYALQAPLPRTTEESLLALRASCQNFFCSHRFRRACQNQALPLETHRAGKRPGCASWSRGPADALTVLRPRTRPQTPTVFPSNGGGSSVSWSLFWCSVASLSSFPAQVHGSPLLSHIRKDTRSVPIDRPVAPFVRSA